MQSVCRVARWVRSLWNNEHGVVLIMALVVMTLLMGVASTAIFSSYTNVLTATNLKLATRARGIAEANINEAIYRLSRQEVDANAIVPNLANSDWQVEINFTSGDNNASDGVVSTIQASADWPDHIPDDPVIVRYKKPDPTGSPNGVLFYDPKQNPKFVTYTLPNSAIPDSAHPVFQITGTALDSREAERQILAEVIETTTFAPPAPLSSGVDVNLNGSGFLAGVNHHHMIYIPPANGIPAIYGDNGNVETTDTHPSGQIKDSPDDNSDTGSGHGIANSSLVGAAFSSYPRLFNMQIGSSDQTPAWVGLTKVNPDKWTGSNTGYASAVALSSSPTVVNDQPPTSGVWTKGVFTWRRNNSSGLGTIPGYPSTCSSATTLVCRPTELTHSADSFAASSHFPFFQEFLGLDDASFQDLLDHPDTTKTDLNAGKPPLGFTYVQGDYTFNNSTASPGTYDFGLLYVTGGLTINGNQTFKGLVWIDGTLKVSGSPVILGAVMVRGS